MKIQLFLFALATSTPLLAQNASTSTSPNSPFKWRLNLRPGQKWRTITDSSTVMTTPMPSTPGTSGAPTAMKNTLLSHLVVDHKVLSNNARGARVEMTYRNVSQNNKMMQGSHIIYDSTHPPVALQGLGDISKNLVGARLTYLLSPNGQISDIQGAEAYLKRLDAAFAKKLAGNPQSAMMRKMLHGAMANSLSADTIKAGLGTAYLAMPKTTVKRGQSWKYTTTVPMMGFKMSQNGQSTFVSRSRGLVTIAEKINFGTGPGSQIKVPGLPNTAFNFQGTSTGKVLVDEATGLSLEHRTVQNLSSKTALNDPTGKSKAPPMRMEFKSQSFTKTQKL